MRLSRRRPEFGGVICAAGSASGSAKQMEAAIEHARGGDVPPVAIPAADQKELQSMDTALNGISSGARIRIEGRGDANGTLFRMTWGKLEEADQIFTALQTRERIRKPKRR